MLGIPVITNLIVTLYLAQQKGLQLGRFAMLFPPVLQV